MNATIALISQPLLPSVGEEEQFQSPSPSLGYPLVASFLTLL
jgi:hypothetical protein